MTPARFLTLVALAAGCDGALPGVCEDGSCGVQVSARRIVQTSVNRRLDLLFVDSLPHTAMKASTTETPNNRYARESSPIWME